jgi:hypothetical protein
VYRGRGLEVRRRESEQARLAAAIGPGTPQMDRGRDAAGRAAKGPSAASRRAPEAASSSRHASAHLLIGAGVRVSEAASRPRRQTRLDDQQQQQQQQQQGDCLCLLGPDRLFGFRGERALAPLQRPAAHDRGSRDGKRHGSNSLGSVMVKEQPLRRASRIALRQG